MGQGLKIRVTTTNFEPFLIKNTLWCKFYHNLTDSMTLSTDTDGTTQTDNAWYYLLFCDTYPEPKFRPPSTSKWAKGSHKPNFDLPVFFRSLQRPCRRWWKTRCINEENRNFEKKRIFVKCTFPRVRSKFLRQDVQNYMHFGSISCVRKWFSSAHTLMFFDPQNGEAQTRKGDRN